MYVYHAWESRLSQPKLSEENVNESFLLRPPSAEKIMGRSTNMNILYILINVTLIGECCLALFRLPKLIFEKDVFLFSLFARNRSYF